MVLINLIMPLEARGLDTEIVYHFSLQRRKFELSTSIYGLPKLMFKNKSISLARLVLRICVTQICTNSCC